MGVLFVDTMQKKKTKNVSKAWKPDKYLCQVKQNLTRMHANVSQNQQLLKSKKHNKCPYYMKGMSRRIVWQFVTFASKKRSHIYSNGLQFYLTKNYDFLGTCYTKSV